jgi:hypothetical protein
MIQTVEARELCSDSEWDQIESSFTPAIEALSLPDLKARLGRVKKLHLKLTELVDRQHSDARKRTTRRKTELFAEAIGRFDAALTVLEKAHRVVPISKDVEKPADEIRTVNASAAKERADRELKSRESHVQSAIAVRGEQQGGKSGARRIQSHVGSAARRQQGRRDSKNS